MDRRKMGSDINGRSDTADVFKGILIFCVLFGHSVTMINEIRDIKWVNSAVDIFLTSFNMPAFGMVSGFFAYKSLNRRKTPIAVLGSRIKKLVPIIIFWDIIPMIIHFFTIEKPTSVMNLIQVIYSSIFSGGLWYIASFLTCSIGLIVYWVLEVKVFRDKWAFRIVLISTSIVFIHVFPLSFAYSTFLFPFYLIGYYICKYDLLNKNVFNKVIVVSGSLFPVLLFFYTPEISFYWLDSFVLGNVSLEILGIFIYRFVCAISGISAFYCLSKYGSSFFNKRIKEILVKFGGDSLQIYILSMYIQGALANFIRLFISPESLNDMNILFSIAPLFCIILIFSSYLINRFLVKTIPFVAKYILGNNIK